MKNTTRYIHLFNFENSVEINKARAFLVILPSAKLEPYGIIGRKENRTWDKSWCSLWVPEEFFMLAWTYFSYRDLKDAWVSPEEGLAYFEQQKNDSDFVKEQ